MNRILVSMVVVAGLMVSTVISVRAQEAAKREYFVYALSESADQISVVRFGPHGAKLEQAITTGLMEPDIDGPHGVIVSPDSQFYYVSLGHGRPFGTVWKYSTRDNRVLGKVTLGFFPASMDISPDGDFLYVVNFNLHGDMVPSSVSVVLTDSMIELKRITTCTMPHGSRLNLQGTRQYSTCMMDDMLVEIDTETFRVSRHFTLAKGKAAGREGPPPVADAAHHHAGHVMSEVSCSPTWAQPSADGSMVFVACNKSNEIVEIDAQSWKLTRRLTAGEGVYNLAVTRDGRLIATNKRGQSTSIFDLKSGKEMARIPTRRKVVHGVVVSPDDKYAFISVEGVGAEPGTVEVIDLRSLKTVATIDVAQQASGIAFWKMN